MLSPAAQPVVNLLAYSSEDTGITAESRVWRIARCVLFLPGLVVPWMEFTYSSSPMDAIREFFKMIHDRQFESYLMLIVIAAGLSFPAILWGWLVRLIVSTGIGKVERRLVLGAALILILACLSFSAFFLVVVLRDHGDPEAWMLLTGPAVLVVVSPILWMLRRSPLPHVFPLAGLLAGYVSIAGMGLILFADSRDPGWWVTAMLCGVGAADLLMLFIRQIRTRRKSLQ
jgi:hypothetical protein